MPQYTSTESLSKNIVHFVLASLDTNRQSCKLETDFEKQGGWREADAVNGTNGVGERQDSSSEQLVFCRRHFAFC